MLFHRPDIAQPDLASAQTYHLLEEAREIHFTRSRLPSIFYFNQITGLLQHCPDPKQKMDLLLASCQEEAHEAISTLVPPVQGWDVDTEISRALEGLRLRYRCSSFLSEPLVKRVRLGPKINRIDANTLKRLITDINECELYARANKYTRSLDSSFILDIGECFPFFFKNRYADYLQDCHNNPDQPIFDFFKKFLHGELNQINTTFDQRFLGTTKKRTNHKVGKAPIPKVKVHRVNVETKLDLVGPSSANHSACLEKMQLSTCSFTFNKSLPVCFICLSHNLEQCHLLYHCEKYQKMSPQNRHNDISQAGHCTNCLQQHLDKDCTQLCKCKHCHNTFTPKDTSLHELYNQASHSGVNLGAATSVGGPPKVSHGAAASKSCKPANTIHPPA